MQSMVLTTSLHKKEIFSAHIMTMQCIAWTSSPQPPLALSNPLQDDWLRSTPHFSQARSGSDSGEVAQFYLLITRLMQCVCGEHRPNCLIQVASLVWLLLFSLQDYMASHNKKGKLQKSTGHEPQKYTVIPNWPSNRSVQLGYSTKSCWSCTSDKFTLHWPHFVASLQLILDLTLKK